MFEQDVVLPKKVAAIGEYENDKSYYVDLNRAGSSLWTYSLGRTTFDEEQFRDIAYAGGKVVVLTRFNDPVHSLFYKYGIGLRYGTPGSFISTSNKIYTYSTRDVYGDSRFGFDPDGPLVFAKTHYGGGVAVGYVCNPVVPMDEQRGKLIFFVFHSENDHYPVCLTNTDGQRYKTIKDISTLSQDKNVVLLEDSLNRSVLRFPLFVDNEYEAYLKLSGPEIMSVSAFQYQTFGMGMIAGGNYPNSQNMVSCYFENNILSRINSWNPGNCAEKAMGGSNEIEFYANHSPVDSTLTLITTKKVGVITDRFLLYVNEPVRECTDVN